MTRRSLKLSPTYFAEAQKKLNAKGWTQKQLADFAGCSPQPVSKFFNGKPVDKSVFVRICQELGLDPKVVTDHAGDQKNSDASIVKELELDIDNLVEKIRLKTQQNIIGLCGAMRVLDMSYPIGVDNIYTKVNVLEKVTGQKRKNLSQLIEECDRDYHERWQFSDVDEPRIDGLKVVKEHYQLMILGKPGAGKTTFLKHLAMGCANNSLFTDLVPFFICLKDFAEADGNLSLQDYIAQQVISHEVTKTELTRLIDSGRALVLLDGLDEVCKDNIQRVIKEIRNFSRQHENNRLIVTCRIAAQEYTFEKFTEVEIADFDDEQIKSFAHRWFKAKNLNLEKQFIEQLRNNPPIKELANRPLLLTLLCLEFEDSGEFPSDVAELYRRAINTLLRKWDAKRCIYRDEVYKNLSSQKKEDLLSYIAQITFEQQKYFFKQRELEGYIADYISNLSKSFVDEETLLLDSEAVLKSVEAQHGLLVERAKGIYSFSHLTIHEYFAARAIVSTVNPNNLLDSTLNGLSRKIFDKQWREVFLITSQMLSKADSLLLLMKITIDKAVSENRKIQEFLSWINYKSNTVNSPHQASAVRAFYICQAIAIYTLDSSNYPLMEYWQIQEISQLLGVLDPNLGIGVYYGCGSGIWMGSPEGFVEGELELDLNLCHARAQASLLARTSKLDDDSWDWMDEYEREHPFDDTNFGTLIEALYCAVESTGNSELKRSLITLQQQLPDSFYDDWDTYLDWYNNYSETWAVSLRQLSKEYRHVDYDWNFGDREWGIIRAYCYANKLLIDCLNSQTYVSREVRKEIESSLLLPFLEIKNKLEMAKL